MSVQQDREDRQGRVGPFVTYIERVRPDGAVATAMPTTACLRAGWPAVPPATPGGDQPETPEAPLPLPITSGLSGWRCECMAEAKPGRSAARAGTHRTGEP
jgi:hypothetical protein